MSESAPRQHSSNQRAHAVILIQRRLQLLHFLENELGRKRYSRNDFLSRWAQSVGRLLVVAHLLMSFPGQVERI